MASSGQQEGVQTVIKHPPITVSVPSPGLMSSSQTLPKRHPDGLLQETEQFTPSIPFIDSSLTSAWETKGNAHLFLFFFS